MSKHAHGKPAAILDQSLIPGGIKPTDYIHRVTNDGTCSRCRREVPDDEVPLLLWSTDGNDMWIFCDNCLAWWRPKER